MTRSIAFVVVSAGLAFSAHAGGNSASAGCTGCESRTAREGFIKPLCLMQPSVPFDLDGITPMTVEEMKAIVAARGEPDMVIRSRNRGSGLTVVFNVFGTTNADTVSGLQFTADYYASRIDDQIEVVLNVTFDPGSFGGTGPTLFDVPYTQYLAALQADADADDTVQSLLPGGTFPARRSFGGAVSQEDTLTLDRGRERGRRGAVHRLAARR